MLQSEDTFCINSHYEIHKKEVVEIAIKAISYNESYFDHLPKSVKRLFENEFDALQTLMGSPLGKDQLGERSLAKLTRDICKEFGIKDI